MARRARSVVLALIIGGLLVGSFALPASAANPEHSVVVSDDPVGFTPHAVDGRVFAIIQVGNKMIVGGSFTQVRQTANGANIARNRVFAFDATTGVIDPNFAPDIDGAVYSLVATPDGHVIAGGTFNNVNTVASPKLTKLNLSNGQRVTAFTAKADGRVKDMVLRNGKLYIAGGFGRVNNTVRHRLAAVNPNSGALDPNFVIPVTQSRDGTSIPSVYAMEADPAGTKLMIIGNFTNVGGQSRWQAAMIDLTTSPETVANWHTDRFTANCHPVFDTYMRDVAFSPDGSYFAIVTTGAYGAGTLCDTTSRWESNATGSNLQPTWADYTGGDTLYSVAITGTVIYAGGHQRWSNNAFAGDAAGPGSVSREGIVALDPDTGLALSWNPGRTRGVGVFVLYPTEQGLWLGSDTDMVAGETHRKLALFPLAGGKTIPENEQIGLPNDLYNMPVESCPAPDTTILYRVNGGGPTLQSLDCGPDWVSDDAEGAQYRNTGNGASWGTGVVLPDDFPATTPPQVFQSERWDDGGSPEMEWSFPVAGGTPVEVRLYFANQYDGTANEGGRVFDVSVEGAKVLDDYDIVADTDGTQRAAVKRFSTTSDGAINVLFEHVIENPLINAIEIVRTDLPPGPQPGDVDFLGRRLVNGAGPQASSTVSTPGIDWSETRGAFVNNDVLYVGRQDGTMFAHSFDGQTVGEGTEVDLHGLNTYNFNVASITGMFFDGTRLFYTVAGDGRMHWRYFLPESQLVGALEFTIDGDWSDVAGMTMADDKIYYARTNGNLYSMDFADAAPVAGSEVLVSPATAGYNWASRGMFVYHQFADNQAPTVPGKPTGTSTTPSSIDLSWSPSSDASAITYRVYRDGGTSPIGETAGTNWTDTGLVPGSTHTYTVEAIDAFGNESALSPASDAITTPLPPDTEAPDKPAAPTGVSNTTDSIDVSWTATIDDRPGTITYRLYRDGGTLVTETTGTTFQDAGLAPGSTHTYTVEAEDVAENVSELSDASAQVTVQTPDTTAPDKPAAPTGVSNTTDSIDVSWTATIDDRPGTITYRLYRDGGTLVTETTGTTFQDAGLAPGSTHTYTVEAEDVAENVSELSDASAQVTVKALPAQIFTDDFSTGNLSKWAVTGSLVIDTTRGQPAASARGAVTNAKAMASRTLPSTYGSLCMSTAVNVQSVSAGTDLFRLRTSTGGPIVKVYVAANRKVFIRSDVSSQQVQTSATLPLNGWATVELCGTVGTAGTWDLMVNGTVVRNDWVANTGTAPVGRVQIGDSANKTWTINYDNVVVDLP